jgi:hypothetical protein
MAAHSKHEAFCAEVARIQSIKVEFKGDADFIETAIVKGWTLEQAKQKRQTKGA